MPSLDPKSRANSTTFVYVGCKLPHGLILEILTDSPAPQPGMVTSPAPTGPRYMLKGPNSVRNDFTLRGLAQLDYPFAVTAIPKDFWDAWLARNKDFSFVKGGLVFALGQEKAVIIESRNRLSERTGLEPMRPDCEKDPRLPQNKNLPPVERVTVDAEHLAKLQTMNGRDLR